MVEGQSARGKWGFMHVRGHFLPVIGAGAVLAVIAGGILPEAAAGQPTDAPPSNPPASVLEHPDGSGPLPAGGGVRDPRLSSQSLQGPRARVSARARNGARKALRQSALVRGLRPNRPMPREPYISQRGCYPYGLPGVVAFRDMLLQTYPRSEKSLGIYNIGRGCNTPGISEHEEGRALDFEADIRNGQQHAQAVQVLRWLTKNHGYQARRWGILYIIYNQRIWGQYSPRWRGMASRGNWTDNHKDHIHFTFTWNGALKQSAYWTGKVRRTNYGPCPTYAGSYGPVNVAQLTKSPRTWPCGSGKRVPRAWRTSSAIMYWQSGDRVKWLQEYLKEQGVYPGEVHSSFDQLTYDAVVAWQRGHFVTPTGVWDPESQHRSARVVGQRAPTTLSGWDPAEVPVTVGQRVPFSVTVASDRVAERTVRLQRRSREVGAKWETLVEQRLPVSGIFSGALDGLAGQWDYRVVVLESSWAERAQSDPKLVTAIVPTPEQSPSTAPTTIPSESPSGLPSQSSDPSLSPSPAP
jgi:Putative peptidoglycan binding domain